MGVLRSGDWLRTVTRQFCRSRVVWLTDVVRLLGLSLAACGEPIHAGLAVLEVRFKVIATVVATLPVRRYPAHDWKH